MSHRVKTGFTHDNTFSLLTCISAAGDLVPEATMGTQRQWPRRVLMPWDVLPAPQEEQHSPCSHCKK